MERGVTFEPVVRTIEAGNTLDIIEHPNHDRYPLQRIFIIVLAEIVLAEYVYLVPFVEGEKAVFLKTIIPSRKMKKRYLGEGNNA